MHYRQHIQTSEQTLAQLAQKSTRMGLLRFALFIVFVLVLFLLPEQQGWALTIGIAILIVIVFAWVMILDKRNKYRMAYLQQYVVINQREIQLGEHNSSGLDSGKSFYTENHPYADDLDLFGEGSLYQHFNRAETALGRKRFAQYLSRTPESLVEITARQASVAELSSQLDWRQAFQTYAAMSPHDDTAVKGLLAWMAQPSTVAAKSYTPYLLILGPIYMTTGLVLGFAEYFPWSIITLSWLPGLLYLRQHLTTVNETVLLLGKNGALLRGYEALIKHVEQHSFSSEKTKQLQEILSKDSATQAIKKLSYYNSQLDVRHNPLALPFIIFTFWDIQWLWRIERWRKRHAQNVPNWFMAISELEALNSLATLKYNHPDWTVPCIEVEPALAAAEVLAIAHSNYPGIKVDIKEQSPGQPYLQGSQIGHPLINPAKRVDNDFTLSAKPHLYLITGSNMAGKSTFLRSVGINVVLAMCGSVVCAKDFRTPILSVYTSMRTRDALQDDTSSFYAELKRLNIIIEAVKAQSNVLYLLDEVFKGTNSRDQHTGAMALAKQLLAYPCAGILATHDLSIGELLEQKPQDVTSACFEVDLSQEDELYFDYKLKPGMSKNSSATQLMRKMGIEFDQN